MLHTHQGSSLMEESELALPTRKDGTGDQLEERSVIINKVRHALSTAREAVVKDHANAIDPAIELYQKAIEDLTSLSKDVPLELQANVIVHRDRYTQRAEVLKSYRSTRPPSQPPLRPMSRGAFEGSMEELDRVIRHGNLLNEVAQKWEPEPESSLLRPFWMLRLIRSTIVTGGFITPKSHVPKLVWEQGGARFTGLSQKITALETVLGLLIDRVRPLDYPKDDEPVQAQKALNVFVGLRAELDSMQNGLARPFSFIKEVGSTVLEQPVVMTKTTAETFSSMTFATAGLSSVVGGGGGGGGPNIQQRLNNMVLSIGKTVKKSAVTAYTAYERIGAAVPGNITESELRSFASLVAEVSEKSQILDEWYVFLEGKRKGLQDNLRQQALGGDKKAEQSVAVYQMVEQMLMEFCHIARFMREVVVELLLRDLQGLLDSYLRKMRKTFARMQWDEDLPEP